MRLANLVSWILVICGLLYLALGLAYFFIGLFPMSFRALSFGYSAVVVSNLVALFLTSLSAIALGILLVHISESPITQMRNWLEFKRGGLNSGKILPAALEITAILWFVTNVINMGDSFYAALREGNFTIVMSTVIRLVVVGCPAFAISLLLRKRLANPAE